jgi:hypothetical protein
MLKKIIQWIDGNPYDPVLDAIDKLPTTEENENVQKVYESRWLWYHTILAVELFFTNLLLFAILVLLAIKL